MNSIRNFPDNSDHFIQQRNQRHKTAGSIHTQFIVKILYNVLIFFQ